MMKIILLIIAAVLLTANLSQAQPENKSAQVISYQALRSQLMKDTNITVYKNKPTVFNSKRDYIKIGGLGVVIAGSAAATIKFKQIANNAYDNYLNTQQQSDLDKSNRYDKYSTISLIIMEAAFACMVYLLFFDK